MLCYSTGSLPDGFTLPRIAEALSGTPFTGVELVLTASMLEKAGDTAWWHAVRDGFHARGLAFRNIHLGAPFLLGPEPHRPGLSSLDAAGRARKAEAARKALAVAACLDCPAVCLTTGLPEAGHGEGNPSGTVTPMAPPAQIAVLEAEIAALAEARPAGAVLLVEQEPEHVIHSAAQLAGLGGRFPGAVFANYDVGHGHVLGEDPGAAIRALGPGLRNVHLEDIKGRVHRHLLYGEGDVDFAAVFAALRDIGYRGDYTPDLYPFKDDWKRAMEASVAFLGEHGVLAGAL
jgi:sugar phosphate isomerase/epimerase